MTRVVKCVVVIQAMIFFLVLSLGLCCFAFAKSLALALNEFDLYTVHELSSNVKDLGRKISHEKISQKSRDSNPWVQSENALHCATRPNSSQDSLFKFDQAGQQILQINILASRSWVRLWNIGQSGSIVFLLVLDTKDFVKRNAG